MVTHASFPNNSKEGWRLEGYKFKSSLGYLVRHYFKIKNKKRGWAITQLA